MASGKKLFLYPFDLQKKIIKGTTNVPTKDFSAVWG